MRELTGRYIQRPRLNTPQEGWLVHHTVTNMSPDATEAQEIAHIDSINRWHRDNRGFSMGIGYHVLVFPSERAYKVGHYDTSRAHVRNKNHRFLGLAFVGAYTVSAPSSGMLKVAAEIIRESKRPLIGGHKSAQISTFCPGSWPMEALRNYIKSPAHQLDVSDLPMWFALSVAIGNRRARFVRFKGDRLVYELELEDWS